MKENKSRRKFLQKVVYKAPIVLALGSLMAPISANASNASGGFPTASTTDDTTSTNAGLDSSSD